MRIARKNLKLLIESAVSEEIIANIERLWWNDRANDYPDRTSATHFIETLDIDPRSLKIWHLTTSDGEWFDIKTSAIEVTQALEEYNNHPQRPFKMSKYEYYIPTSNPDYEILGNDAYITLHNESLVGSYRAWEMAKDLLMSILTGEPSKAYGPDEIRPARTFTRSS